MDKIAKPTHAQIRVGQVKSVGQDLEPHRSLKYNVLVGLNS